MADNDKLIVIDNGQWSMMISAIFGDSTLFPGLDTNTGGWCTGKIVGFLIKKKTIFRMFSMTADDDS